MVRVSAVVYVWFLFFSGAKAVGEEKEKPETYYVAPEGNFYVSLPYFNNLLTAIQGADSKKIMEIRDSAKDKSEAAAALVALALTSEDWIVQRSALSEALQNSPDWHAPQFLAELLSLKVGQAVTRTQYHALARVSFTNQIGLGATDEYPETTLAKLWDAAVNAVLNTGNCLAIYFNYADDLNTEYAGQLEQLTEISAGLNWLEANLLRNGGTLKDLADELEKIESAKLRVIVRTTYNSMFVKNIRHKHLYSKPIVNGQAQLYPHLSHMNYTYRIDFLRTDWRFALAEQSNLLNGFMFTRMPAWIERFGGTSVGTFLVTRLQLTAVTSMFRAMPWPASNVGLWFAGEVADGCVPRWIYAGYSFYSRVNGDGDTASPAEELHRIGKIQPKQ